MLFLEFVRVRVAQRWQRLPTCLVELLEVSRCRGVGVHFFVQKVLAVEEIEIRGFYIKINSHECIEQSV